MVASGFRMEFNGFRGRFNYSWCFQHASAGAYSGRCHVSGMESFAGLVGYWGPLTILAFWQSALS